MSITITKFNKHSVTISLCNREHGKLAAAKNHFFHLAKVRNLEASNEISKKSWLLHFNFLRATPWIAGLFGTHGS
jgi:hypothetical protein